MWFSRIQQSDQINVSFIPNRGLSHNIRFVLHSYCGKIIQRNYIIVFKRNTTFLNCINIILNLNIIYLGLSQYQISNIVAKDLS